MNRTNWSYYPENPEDWTWGQKMEHYSNYLLLVAMRAEEIKKLEAQEREAEELRAERS